MFGFPVAPGSHSKPPVWRSAHDIQSKERRNRFAIGRCVIYLTAIQRTLFEGGVRVARERTIKLRYDDVSTHVKWKQSEAFG